MQKRDYYDILGVGRNASEDEIKRAYKELAKKYHPDISSEKDAEEKFKEIQEAYSVLSDKQKRQAYDQFGHGYDAFKGFQGFRGTEGFEGFSSFDFDFSDIFNAFSRSGFGDFFGEEFGTRTTRKQSPKKGSDIKFTLSISFEEAAFGTEKEILIERTIACNECNGKGYKSEKDISTCPNCGGAGQVSRSSRTPFGFFQTITTCHKCGGTGKFSKNPCSECKGEGIKKEKKKVKVKVPAGIDSGNYLRLAGQGNAGIKGGPAGDIYVVIFVEPHDIFKRDNFDVYCEIPISFAEAALGAEVEVPTLYGMAKLKIPPGTQSGTIFRLKEKGIQKLNSIGKGDEFVKVILETPKSLSKKERELFEQLLKEEETSKKRKGFFERFQEKIRKGFGS
ncbi:MAG: molecular chaperone DnaJ [Candidatus Diapherotrites archaeon]